VRPGCPTSGFWGRWNPSSSLSPFKRILLSGLSTGVTREQLRRFIRHQYAIGIKFRKMVIGLLYNLSDQDEPISLELRRVLHSEYGQGIHRTVLGPVSNPTES